MFRRFSNFPQLDKAAAVFAIGLAIGTAGLIPSMAATNAAPPTSKSPQEIEADYTQKIEERVAKNLAPLKLEDRAKLKKVHDILVAQYRALRDWHDANDAKRKRSIGEELQAINASLKALHDKFVASLSAELTPEQVEAVKDEMTYGKVQFTYAGYLAAYPNLSEEHKHKIIEFLKEARELAMDGGSAEEKTALFNRYKGRINNWLSAQGVAIGKSKKTAADTTNAPTGKP